MISGEPVPVHGTVHSTADNYLETHCIGLQGSHCVSGSATGLVVATGDSTVLSKIARLTEAPRIGLTSIEKELLRFLFLVVLIMLVNIIIVIIVWYVGEASAPYGHAD
jgi:sodium/potassium-transporting ATPase subunit alpha